LKIKTAGIMMRDSISGRFDPDEKMGAGLFKVPASEVKISAKVFMKTESNIIDAIESLIREPYGCFEQCSSVTYPLVMLLKYMKWAPKTDKTIKMV
jgi:uncharacterized protein YfaS (alpha-2-macroglobulin family)